MLGRLTASVQAAPSHTEPSYPIRVHTSHQVLSTALTILPACTGSSSRSFLNHDKGRWELAAQREQAQQLDVAHGLLQVLVVCRQARVLDVVVARDAPQVRRLRAHAAFAMNTSPREAVQ